MWFFDNAEEAEGESRRKAKERKRLLDLYKKEQGRISRRRLYPMALFYSAYSIIVLVLALRSEHPLLALLFAALGVAVWTCLEYLAHRYVLHGHFPKEDGIVKRFLHRRLDPLHWEHHANPWDGLHINGTLSDTIPLFLVFAPLSFIAPLYTLPVCYAAFLQSYVVEEIVHHSVHFYNFRNPYFRYMYRHHFYHHTREGTELAFGLSNGFWDIVFATRIPHDVRSELYASGERPSETKLIEHLAAAGRAIYRQAT